MRVCASVWGSMLLPCLSQICIPVGSALAIVSAYKYFLWPRGAYCPRFCCKVYCLCYTVSRKLHAEISVPYQEVWLKGAACRAEPWLGGGTPLPTQIPSLRLELQVFSEGFPCFVCWCLEFCWFLSDSSLRGEKSRNAVFILQVGHGYVPNKNILSLLYRQKTDEPWVYTRFPVSWYFLGVFSLKFWTFLRWMQGFQGSELYNI